MELYFAVASGVPAGTPHSDPAYYLQRAAHWANAYINSPDDAADSLNLYDVSGLPITTCTRPSAWLAIPRGSRSPRRASWPT